MIEFISAPDHVAAFRIAGTLRSEDYDAMIPRIEEKLEGHETIGIFVDMEDFEDMTADAIGRDIKPGIDRLRQLHRFGRAAIATDSEWVRAAAEMADILFPQLEARAFAVDDKGAAMDWVSRLDPAQ